jgi:hypothetical protein
LWLPYGHGVSSLDEFNGLRQLSLALAVLAGRIWLRVAIHSECRLRLRRTRQNLERSRDGPRSIWKLRYMLDWDTAFRRLMLRATSNGSSLTKDHGSVRPDPLPAYRVERLTSFSQRSSTAIGLELGTYSANHVKEAHAQRVSISERSGSVPNSFVIRG